MSRRPIVRQWLAEPTPLDVREAIERLSRGADVARVAVMPDVHLSADVCVGVALATYSTLVPAAVGGDIGCGMAAIGFHGSAQALADAEVAAKVLQGLVEGIPILRHRRGSAPDLPTDLKQESLHHPNARAVQRKEAGLQFGSLGRGNHFVELQSDEDDRLWLMVHSGSRRVGQAIRHAHEPHEARDNAGLRSLDAHSEPGRGYLHDLRWALRYAEQSRRRMVEVACGVVQRVLGIDADEDTAFDCHHNFVALEEHEGQSLWVHRKGAMSARGEERGIIPGSMGSRSFHVEGRGCAEALCSSSHGAGRMMARSAARRKISVRALHRQMEGVWFDHRLSERLREEAPGAYKDIGAVMRAQRALTRIVRTLRPRLVFKGG